MTFYNETGPHDFRNVLDEYEDAYSAVEQDAGYTLTENLQDRSVRTGLALAGWNPMHNPEMQAVEFYAQDYEYAFPPDLSSQEFSVASYNATFYRWSEENNFVHEPRGYNTFIKGEAATYLQPDDPRLLLNTHVDKIAYSDAGVVVHNADGSCVCADYAICTFSVGVLQNDVVEFESALPS